MRQTRFMIRLFSATNESDEELTNQVHGDIEAAKENGSFEDDEMRYDSLGDGNVVATDKGNGEMTLIHDKDEESDTYDLEQISGEDLEKYLHPEIVNGAVSVNDNVCPNCGSAECDGSCSECDDEQREFSVRSDNTALLKFFSDQETCEALSEMAISTEQPVTVGDLSFEKSDDNEVIVTDKSSGDKAKVAFDGPELEVTELNQKNFKSFSDNNNMIIRRKVFSNAEQYEPMFVVGIDTDNNTLVNAPVMTQEAAQDLANKLADLGVTGIQLFEDPDQAREYGVNLIESNGGVQVEGEVQHEFSDVEGPVYTNRYFSEYVTPFMYKMFSEADEEVTATQDMIEDACANGDQLETEDEVITPVDENTAVVEDKSTGDFTKVDLSDGTMDVEAIDEETANELTDHLEAAEDEEEQKAYSVGSVLKGIKRNVWNKPTSKLAKSITDKATKVMMDPNSGKNAKKLAGKLLEGNVAKNISRAAVGTAYGTGAAAVGAGTVLGVRKLKQKNNSETSESVATIEDAATSAIDNIQQVAAAATEAIQNAKEAPVAPQNDIKEVQYSDKMFSDSANVDTLGDFLG